MIDLKELVERYGSSKTFIKPYEKQIKEDGEAIKCNMAKLSLNTLSSDNFTAKLSVSVSEDFDVDKLTKKLKKYNFNGKSAHELGLIDYVPVVNMEVLEDFIYTGKIDACDLVDCRTKKETSRLTISKIKS